MAVVMMDPSLLRSVSGYSFRIPGASQESELIFVRFFSIAQTSVGLQQKSLSDVKIFSNSWSTAAQLGGWTPTVWRAQMEVPLLDTGSRDKI